MRMAIELMANILLVRRFGQWTGPRAKQLWDFSNLLKSMFDMDTLGCL